MSPGVGTPLFRAVCGSPPPRIARKSANVVGIVCVQSNAMRTYVGLIAVFASACTGDIGSDPGGGGGGGGPPPPPPATDVRLTIQDGFVPQAGVRVLFQNADFSTFMEVTTDATGVADIDFPSGNLTVIRTFPVAAPPATPRPAAVYTYIGV